MTLVAGLTITVCAIACLAVIGAWLLAPFMLYAIDSRLRETNALLRYIATRPLAAEHPAQDTGTPPPTFQLLR